MIWKSFYLFLVLLFTGELFRRRRQHVDLVSRLRNAGM